MILMLVVISDEDSEIIEKYYILFRPTMHNIAFDILKNDDDAEMVVQEAFMKIMSSIDGIKGVPEDSRRAYFNVVAKNVSITIYNRRKILNISPLEEVLEIELTNDDSFVEDHVIKEIDSVMLKEKIKQLESQFSTPLLMRYNLGMNSREIGSVLGISDALARKRIQRALQQLRELLGRDGYLYA